jgi:hypothetical protein
VNPYNQTSYPPPDTGRPVWAQVMIILGIIIGAIGFLYWLTSTGNYNTCTQPYVSTIDPQQCNQIMVAHNFGLIAGIGGVISFIIGIITKPEH